MGVSSLGKKLRKIGAFLEFEILQGIHYFDLEGVAVRELSILFFSAEV